MLSLGTALALLAAVSASDPQTPQASPSPSIAARFADDEPVSLTDLVTALDALAEQLEDHPAVRREFEAFARAHRLPDEALADYVRVKLVFEATRDGGFWHLRWAITNRKPNSEAIWSQFRDASPWTREGLPAPTATAECDELSALFAFLVRKLGVDRVGLFWPEWNHVVAVWTVRDVDGNDVRIVVPTSQIFLSRSATLGTTEFNPRKQKTIYTYKRRDVHGEHRLSAPLARFMVSQAERWAALPLEQAQVRRNTRSQLLDGS